MLQDINNQATGVAPNGGSQMPFDNIDDTLVGIVNTSSKPIFGIQLSGESTSTPIFGFEGDGVCTYATRWVEHHRNRRWRCGRRRGPGTPGGLHG